MKNKNIIIDEVSKLCIAIAAICNPAISVIEPMKDIISTLVFENKSFSKLKRSLDKKSKKQLRQCIKETLASLEKDSPRDTIRKAVDFLEPYIQLEASNEDKLVLNEENLRNIISEGIRKNNIYSDLYFGNNDLEYFYTLFFERFDTFIQKYPELSDRYKQINIQNIIEKLEKELDRIKKEYPSLEISNENLQSILISAFKYEKKNNPSVREIQLYNQILPKGKIQITANIDKEREHVPLMDFFNETWKTNKQRHISITGIGGIGKTVVLFFAEYISPVIYIPLRNLVLFAEGSNQEYITRYIKENTLKSNDTAFQTLMGICDEPWTNGPSCILLLDGMNEITASRLTSIINEIKVKWLRKNGIQLILTSRYDISNKLRVENFHQVQIETLSKNVIIEHLKNVNITLPEWNNRIWKAFDTPLMLMLYSKAEQIKNSHISPFANWKEAKNAGSIIWNYFQSELSKADIESEVEGVVAIHLIAPFICYKMMCSNCFIVSRETFRETIKEAIDYYNELYKTDELPVLISKIIDEFGNSKIEKDHFYNLLTKYFYIFNERNDSVQLVHQHFRDCLAAMHIVQTVEKSKHIPEEWTEPFDLYVSEFIIDLLITETSEKEQISTWKKVWNYGYQKKAGNAYIYKKNVGFI